jgi:hypothetical protein
MRATSMIGVLLLSVQLSGSQDAKRSYNDGARSGANVQNNATFQKQAPDGDPYVPPSAVEHAPKSHARETNVGRSPAPVSGRSEVGWIIGGAAASGGAIVLGEWLHMHNEPESKLSCVKYQTNSA